jgi:hypothetical protein
MHGIQSPKTAVNNKLLLFHLPNLSGASPRKRNAPALKKRIALSCDLLAALKWTPWRRTAATQYQFGPKYTISTSSEFWRA